MLLNYKFIKFTKMEKITSIGFWHNANAKLHIGIDNGTTTGRTMCANVLHSDLKKYLAKQVNEEELREKYFHFNENGIVQYSNPEK